MVIMPASQADFKFSETDMPQTYEWTLIAPSRCYKYGCSKCQLTNYLYFFCHFPRCLHLLVCLELLVYVLKTKDLRHKLLLLLKNYANGYVLRQTTFCCFIISFAMNYVKYLSVADIK